MRINCVNSLNQSVKTNSPAFNGLWNELKSFSCCEYCCIDHVVKSYYPFKDETPEMIRAEAGRPYKDEYRAEWYETGGWHVDTSRSLTIREALPFTRAEFDSYKAAQFKKPQIKTKEHLAIESVLIKAGLSQYIWNIKTLPEVKPWNNWFKKMFSKILK